MNHPYRFPGKPSHTISAARGDDHVIVSEYFGPYGDVVKVWPVKDYRKVNKLAPQDLVIRVPPHVILALTYLYPLH
jgi:hypothetical protein